MERAERHAHAAIGKGTWRGRTIPRRMPCFTGQPGAQPLLALVQLTSGIDADLPFVTPEAVPWRSGGTPSGSAMTAQRQSTLVRVGPHAGQNSAFHGLTNNRGA